MSATVQGEREVSGEGVVLSNGYWLFGRTWNRVEVLTVCVSTIDASHGMWLDAVAIFVCGMVLDIVGKRKSGW